MDVFDGIQKHKPIVGNFSQKFGHKCQDSFLLSWRGTVTSHGPARGRRFRHLYFLDRYTYESRYSFRSTPYYLTTKPFRNVRKESCKIYRGNIQCMYALKKFFFLAESPILGRLSV